jgi:glyoxylase I family protein
MTAQIATGAIHHVTLTVSDVQRSQQFYSLLGFQKVADFEARAALHNGSTLLVIGPAPEQPTAGDRFNENRIGLDHISFSVAHRDDLMRAIATLDEQGVPHGAIKDLPPFQIYVLAFRDPDNIQVELTAPYS